MAWEQRNGRWYYYLKVWSNGTCLTEYMGTGPLAEGVALMQHRQRSKAEEERQELHREQEAQERIDRQIDEVGEHVHDLVTAVLLATGHHRHKRQWRRTRGDDIAAGARRRIEGAAEQDG
jgi:hypothetical protein